MFLKGPLHVISSKTDPKVTEVNILIRVLEPEIARNVYEVRYMVWWILIAVCEATLSAHTTGIVHSCINKA